MRIHVDRCLPGAGEERMERVSVVFPAYREAKHIEEAVRRALEAGAGEVVCVDDCSPDDTGAIIDRLAAREPRVRALHHETNLGKQAAVKHGLQAALRRPDAEALAMLDADMQDDPALLPRMCPFAGPYDALMAVRERTFMPPQRRLSNGLANVAYRLAGIDVHDVQSGYRIYTREVAEYVAERLRVKGGYTLEHTTMLLFGRLARRWGRAFRVAEFVVPYRYGEAESGIGVVENLQLMRAVVYHAAVLAALQR